MPPKSKKQARAMFAAASGKGTKGIPKSVAKEFVEDVKKGDIKKLPMRAKKKTKKKAGRKRR